jgi:HEPN domain-containing protein
MDPHLREALLNEFALRCFRDVADGDYVTARMAYRAELLLQAYWSSQQALEKYLKGILLFRRIPRKKPTHSLKALLDDLEAKLPLRLSKDTREFIKVIENWDVDRYFIYPYGGEGLELVQLDAAVWDVRRYCIPVDPRLSPKGTPLADLDLKHIERAMDDPPQNFRPLSTGVLERVLDDPKNAARSPLIWKNLYFGRSTRKSIKIKQTWSSSNSPLALHPEIIDEVRQYVYLPHGVDLLKRP